jgi:DNA-binding response OmpR family regulator
VFVVRFLNGLNYRVTLARDGMEGLNLARQISPDLIILDLNLPKLNGFAVCRLLKFDDQFKHIPIIMWTWRETKQDREMGKDVGADFYLPKPFSIEALREAIESLIGKIPPV